MTIKIVAIIGDEVKIWDEIDPKTVEISDDILRFTDPVYQADITYLEIDDIIRREGKIIIDKH